MDTHRSCLSMCQSRFWPFYSTIHVRRFPSKVSLSTSYSVIMGFLARLCLPAAISRLTLEILPWYLGAASNDLGDLGVLSRASLKVAIFPFLGVFSHVIGSPGSPQNTAPSSKTQHLQQRNNGIWGKSPMDLGTTEQRRKHSLKKNKVVHSPSIFSRVI